MTESADVRPGNTVQIDGKAVLVVEPVLLNALVAETVTEIRLLSTGAVALSLATLVEDMNAEPEARLVCRLRLAPEVVGYLKRAFAAWDQQSQAAKQAAN